MSAAAWFVLALLAFVGACFVACALVQANGRRDEEDAQQARDVSQPAELDRLRNEGSI